MSLTENEGRRFEARFCLAQMFEPMVRIKVDKGTSPIEARAAAIAWLAGEMGIEPKDCDPTGMTAAETWLAVNIIRDWRQGKTKVRDKRVREEKAERNAMYDKRRAAGNWHP